MAEVANTAGQPVSRSNPERNFHLFAYLNEDIKMNVLSFLADAPFESMPDNYPTSNLTHNLPQVSQKFRMLASSDLYWKDAMVRQTKKEPFLWKSALSQMRRKYDNEGYAEEEKECSPQELVEYTYKSNNYPSYKVFYKNVVSQHLRYKGPVFVMEGQGKNGVLVFLYLLYAHQGFIASTTPSASVSLTLSTFLTSNFSLLGRTV